MTTSGMIVQPPRAFQVIVVVVFEADARTDEEIQSHLANGGVSVSLGLLQNVRQVGAVRVATLPTGVVK